MLQTTVIVSGGYLKQKVIMEMTPKEKAINIFNKCCDYADYTDEDCCFTERETMYKNAKALSFIMVNEILEICPLQNDWYWEEIKQELEKIEICENDVFKLPKKYTEKHLKYAYEQGLKSNNPVYYRSFENVLSILKNSSIENES